MFHVLLKVFVTGQQAVTTLPTARCGVGDIPPGLLPAYFASFAFHERNELFAVCCVPHTVGDDIHELQLLALTAGSGMIFADGHALGLLSIGIWYEHRQRELHTHIVVALVQFLELFFCDMQFLAGIEVDRVDNEVGMDVFSLGMGTHQNFMSIKILSQIQSRGVSNGRIDVRTFRETLHHVVEHRTVRFMVQ